MTPRVRAGRALHSWWAFALGAAIPVTVAGIRGIRSDWYPIGDNAFFPLRGLDVLTEHNPLVGTWTSASLSVDRRINNPGPLLFDLLAGPVRIDVAVGTVVAIVALHLAMVVLGVWFAHRVAGPLGAAAAAAAFAALQWAMGSEILVEPWQPHSLLPAFLAYLVLIWAVASGLPTALPWAAAVGSLVLQTHLSYAVLVPGLALLGAVALVVVARRGAEHTHAGTCLRRPVVASIVVLVAAWALPVYDQLFGQGNLRAVLSGGSGADQRAGVGFAARVVASVGAVPGGWTPGGFSGLEVDLLEDRAPGVAPRLEGLATTGSAVAWGIAAAAAVVVVTVLTWRRRDRVWATALAVAAAAMALTVVTIGILPVSPVLGVAAHQLRPVWPVVLFSTACVLAAALVVVPKGAAAMGVVLVVLVVLGIPARNAATGPSADAWAIPIVRELVSQLGPLDDAGLVLVDLSVIRFAEPYSTPVMLELERRGVPFVVDDPIAVGQLGVGRALRPGDTVDLVLRVVDGHGAESPEAGWERLAYVPGRTDRETAAVLVRRTG